MANSEVVSVRVPGDLLEVIDRLAAEQYPSRRADGKPNRSQVILDAIAVYAKNSTPAVNTHPIVPKEVSNTVIKAVQIEGLEELVASLVRKQLQGKPLGELIA